MHFPDRIYGMENEFGVVRIFPDKKFGNVDYALGYGNLDVKLTLIPRSIFAAGMGQERIWHSNGSCTYIDTGYHPEHATAECRSVRDVVRHNKAGELLITRVFDAPMANNGKLLLVKNNAGVDEQGNTAGEYGCHENYFTYAKTVTDPIAGLPFIPFLITRQILDGAGWWTRDKNFCFSQRALSIKNEFNISTAGERGIINPRLSTDTGLGGRLHLILGDSNMLEFAIYLKVGTTALILNLIETQKIPLLKCIYAVPTIQAISAHYDALEPLVDITGSGRISPFEVQTIYLEAARKELKEGTFDSEETETELKHIALCWEQALNAIYNHDIKWMLGRIDHVTKKYLGDIMLRHRKADDSRDVLYALKDIDIFYHEITLRKFQDRINATWPGGRLFNDNDIQEAALTPPSNTRACCRSTYVDFLYDHNIKYSGGFLQWQSLREHVGTAIYDFNCPDPLQWNQEHFTSFMKIVKDRYLACGSCPTEQ